MGLHLNCFYCKSTEGKTTAPKLSLRLAVTNIALIHQFNNTLPNKELLNSKRSEEIFLRPSWTNLILILSRHYLVVIRVYVYLVASHIHYLLISQEEQCGVPQGKSACTTSSTAEKIQNQPKLNFQPTYMRIVQKCY